MIDPNNINPMSTSARLYVAVGPLLALAPEPVRAALEATYNQGPVEKLVYGMEALYALIKADAVPVADLGGVAQALGEAAYLVSAYNFHGEAVRATALYNAARRVLGEDVPGEDPEVADRFLPPLVPPEAGE